MQLLVRSWNVCYGHVSRLVSIFERRNPQALLEREQDKFRVIVGQFNAGLVSHATLIERLKSAVAGNISKSSQLAGKLQALSRAGDRKGAGRYALELQQIERLLAGDLQKLDDAEAKYRYLVEARDSAVTQTRRKIEQLRWQIGDLKVNRAMADLENMAASMVGGIADPGDSLNRLEEMVSEENDKAKARARVANASFTATGFAEREIEQEALADQALEEFFSRDGAHSPLALPDLTKMREPVTVLNRSQEEQT